MKQRCLNGLGNGKGKVVVCPNSFERYSISGGFGFMT
jgi:hypothetical protein